MPSCNCPTAGEPSFWLEVLKLAIPALIVIAGWFIVSQQQNRRERRKEIRELISLIKSNIEEMVQDSVTYFREADDEKAQIIAGRMKYASIMVSKTLLLISTAGLDIDCNEEMLEFRSATMGEFFETSERRKQAENQEWAQNLALSAGAVLDKIETAYFSFFKLSMESWQGWLDKKLSELRAKGYRAD